MEPSPPPLVHAAATGAPIASLILELWKSIRIDWGFATDRVADLFRRRRELGRRERSFVAETVYGMVRHLRRLDAALAAGGVVAANAAPDRERLLAYLVLEAGLAPSRAAEFAPHVDWSAVAAIDDRIARLPSARERIGVRHSLPDWLAGRLVAERGDQAADALGAALGQRAPMTVRANTLKTSRDELAAALGAEGIDSHPGRYADTALIIDTRTNLFGLQAFKRGLFEAQDEGSQLIAELVAPPPKGLIVDICAGAGGKALALAAALAGRGRVVATDIDPRKLAELRRRARRAGASNIHATPIDGDARAPWPAPVARYEARASRVLVDAPCSGIGALRRNPEARWRMTESEVDRMPALQLAIADRALSLLAPGGRLIYATCTLFRGENQAIVAALLARHADLELVPAKAIWGKQRAALVTGDDGAFLEVDPARHGTDGFFAAALRRRE